MAIDYAKLRTTAEKLISANGASCTFVRNSRTPADATKPWRGPVTSGGGGPISITVTAVVVPNVEKDDKEAMRRGDATAYVAADTFGSGSPTFVEAAAEGFDFMTDSQGVIWRVLSVDILAPGPLRVVYVIVLEH